MRENFIKLGECRSSGSHWPTSCSPSDASIRTGIHPIRPTFQQGSLLTMCLFHEWIGYFSRVQPIPLGLLTPAPMKSCGHQPHCRPHSGSCGIQRLSCHKILGNIPSNQGAIKGLLLLYLIMASYGIPN